MHIQNLRARDKNPNKDRKYKVAYTKKMHTNHKQTQNRLPKSTMKPIPWDSLSFFKNWFLNV